jgi:hypothetical protein
MAFKDFTYRVRVADSRACRNWAQDNVKTGHWGTMIGISGMNTSTYCFEFEEDALAFKLVHGKDVCTNASS